MAAAEAYGTRLESQRMTLDGMKTSSDNFGDDSAAEPVVVPERNPLPFAEQFACTAAEAVLREHYAANGPTPFEAVEPSSPFVPPSARRSVMIKSATKRLSVVDLASLNSLNVQQLRQLCVDNDITKEGKKDELVKRLANAGVRSEGAKTPRSTPRRSCRADPNVECSEEGCKDATTVAKDLLSVNLKKAVSDGELAAKKGGPPSKLKGVGIRRSGPAALKEVNA